MSDSPDDQTPVDDGPIIDEPPIDPENDTRPLKPLAGRERPVQASQEDQAGTILQESSHAASLRSRLRKMIPPPQGDTNRVRIVPKVPNPPPWRLIMQLGTTEQTTMGVDVRQALVIGRNDPDSEIPPPGIDLTPYLGLEHGISRQHAVLIPTPEALYLADMGSTNGTWINGNYLEPGQRYPLAAGDYLELGLLEFQVRSVTLVNRQTRERPS